MPTYARIVTFRSDHGNWKDDKDSARLSKALGTIQEAGAKILSVDFRYGAIESHEAMAYLILYEHSQFIEFSV